MRKVFFLIGVFILFLSCQNIKDKKKVTQYIENDSLISSWISELIKKSKKDKRFKVENTLRKNRHWDYMDTIKNFTYDESRLTILSTEGYYGLWTAELRNAQFSLSNGIKVGMKKSLLEKKLGVKIKGDIVEIGNFEQTTAFEFINQRLDKISIIGFED